MTMKRLTVKQLKRTIREAVDEQLGFEFEDPDWPGMVSAREAEDFALTHGSPTSSPWQFQRDLERLIGERELSDPALEVLYSHFPEFMEWLEEHGR